MRRVIAAASCALLAGAAWGQDLDEAAALSLPGSVPQAAESPRPWRLFIEGAAGRAVVRDASFAETPRSAQRVSLDLQADVALAPGWRGVLADRLDVESAHRFARRDEVNTLKEAYLSWRPRNDVIVDFGRVNQYSGIAIGYNPTDFFRDNALRSVVSVDPASIKKNRQGSIMLRGQALWDGASLTALYSPGLGTAASEAPFSLNTGATNPRDRALVIFSKRLSSELSPQWLLYKEQGGSPQFGMNLTRLVNDSTVAYLEWSGGRNPSPLRQVPGFPADEAFRNRVSTGLTYTTANKLSLTLEYEYNGAGLDKTAWTVLPQVALPAYIQYRQRAQSAQEMPTRREMFLYATWQDILIRRLDMTAMVRRNGEDHSRLGFAEARYHLTRDEIAVQWQGNSGNMFSEYGASAMRRRWQVLYMHFF